MRKARLFAAVNDSLRGPVGNLCCGRSSAAAGLPIESAARGTVRGPATARCGRSPDRVRSVWHGQERLLLLRTVFCCGRSPDRVRSVWHGLERPLLLRPVSRPSPQHVARSGEVASAAAGLLTESAARGTVRRGCFCCGRSLDRVRSTWHGQGTGHSTRVRRGCFCCGRSSAAAGLLTESAARGTVRRLGTISAAAGLLTESAARGTVRRLGTISAAAGLLTESAARGTVRRGCFCCGRSLDRVRSTWHGQEIGNHPGGTGHSTRVRRGCFCCGRSPDRVRSTWHGQEIGNHPGGTGHSAI